LLKFHKSRIFLCDVEPIKKKSMNFDIGLGIFVSLSVC
jgi:hypothetical protein